MNKFVIFSIVVKLCTIHITVIKLTIRQRKVGSKSVQSQVCSSLLEFFQIYHRVIET